MNRKQPIRNAIFLVLAWWLYTWVQFAHSQSVGEALVGRTTPPRNTWQFLKYEQDLYAAVEALCPIARGTTYYIDATDGSDSNNGLSTGAAWKTVSKVNTLLASGAITNTAILFQRGEVFSQSTGIEVGSDDDDTTFGTYGTGPRPLIHCFTTTFASGGTLWTQYSTTDRYYATLATAPGWVRIASDRKRILRKVVSTAEVESTANSWYWASSTLHLNITDFTGAATDPDNYVIECVPTSMTDDDGIYVPSACTHVRVDGIDFDGWTIDGGGSNQSYGVRVGATGSDVVLVTNCGCHFSERHPMGHNDSGSATSSGGLTVWAGCNWGGVRESNGDQFVSYAENGAQECHLFYNVCDLGALPITATGAGTSGDAFITHSEPGYYAGLIVVIGLQAVNQYQGFSVGNLTRFNSCAYSATAADCTGVIIGGKLGPISNVTNGQRLDTGTIDIGSTYDVKLSSIAGEGLYVNTASGAQRGWLFNTSTRVDITAVTSYSGVFGLFNGPNEVGNAAHLFNNQFVILDNGRITRYGILHEGIYNTDAAVDDRDGSDFVNNVCCVQWRDPLVPGSRYFYPGCRNSASYLRNNAVYGGTLSGTYAGWDADSGLIQLDRVPELGELPTVSSPLVGAGEAGILYDAAFRRRSVLAPAIGPFEPLQIQPQALFGGVVR